MFPADERPFLAAIVARPADDEPRLVYADYLDETGQTRDAARAELVRVQIALHRLPHEDSRRPAIAERESELLESFRNSWAAPLAKLGVKFQFRRGLPDAVSIDAALFLRRGEELFDNTSAGTGRSFLSRLRLEDAHRLLPELAACPWLNRIEELDLSGSDLGNAGLHAFLGSKFLRNLRAFDLGNNRLDDSAAAALARSDSMPRCRSLGLADNDIGAAGVSALCDSPFLAGLVELDLTGNEVDETGVRSLVDGPATRRIERLKLADNPLREGLISLAQSDLFARLSRLDSHLDLHRCGIEANGAAALAASPAFAAIESLEVGENYLGDAGAAALARASHLRVLSLVRNQISDAGAAAILAGNMPKLERLDVSNNRLTPRGVDTLKAAARDRGFTLLALNNGTETMAALPPPPEGISELERVARIKRGLFHPASRPGL